MHSSSKSPAASQVSLSPAQAAQEVLRRRRARENLTDYSRAIIIPGVPVGDDPDGWVFKPIETDIAMHHVLVMNAIQQTVRKPYGRLMLLLPPGSAKSTFASVVAPTWVMGANPGTSVLMCSYAASPIERHSKRARQIAASPEFSSIFGTELVPGSNAANQWALTNGSNLFAAGLLGGITSTRCDLGIVDDPVGGREEANSETIRKKTKEAYEDDFLTRLKPGAPVIMIQTRWNEDDLAGGILPEDYKGESGFIQCRDGQTWYVLCIQAKCERPDDPLKRAIGDYLWPEWFTPEHWALYEKNPRTWEALFQQRPRALGGAFFNENNFLVDGQPIDMPKMVDTVYAVIDSAVKTGKKHDGTAVEYFGRSQHWPPPLAILDWDIKQIEGAFLDEWLPKVFERLEELARECNARMGIAGVWIEDKASGMVLLQQARKLHELHPEWKVYALDSKLSAMGKTERALNGSGYIHTGMVKITRPAYEKTVDYKNSRKNHLLSQVLGFDPSIDDQGADDLLDTNSYGIAIGLGDQTGF